MPKHQKSPTEDRDQQVLRRLSNIEHKVDSVEQSTAFALRADADRHLKIVKKFFGRSKRRAQIYLAANGQRAVQDIAKLLKVSKENNVSAELRVIAEESLLEVLEKDGGKTYWGKKSIDRTLRISKFLMGTFHLDKDGLPKKK